MEMEARARELVRAYRKRKGLAWIILAVGIVYLFYIVFRVLEGPAAEELGGLAMTALLFSAYVVFALFAVAAVLVKQSGGMILNRVYQEQCDPALYEACLLKLHFFLQPGWKACNLAIAQYQQGDYGRAQDTLASVPVQKLRKNLIPGYYQCLCALCFKQGRGEEVAALEEACRLALGPKPRWRQQFALVCANNNLFRAVENRDYEKAFLFLQATRRTGTGSVSWKMAQVTYSMWMARICLGLGEKKSAGMYLAYVKQQGGTMAAAEEARQLLQEC